jgi:amidase
LAAGLAARRFSAVELTQHAIARIEALDGPVNAVVVRDFERARAAAAQADAALARGERRPLLGIPMTVKESFNVAGLPTTWGIVRFKGWQAAQDALIVARAKAAGAIVLGKTNVPLLLADWQAFNDIYGTTNNPWDLARTPGGSSGGAAASLAAGYVPLELGSDIGGSLRAPAHYCGVFAHKPSHGLVPTRGTRRRERLRCPSKSIWRWSARWHAPAADLELMLDVIAGPDEPLAAGYRLALRPARHDRLRAFRVLVVDTHPLLPTAQSVRLAVDGLANKVATAGAKVARSSPLLPDLAQAAHVYARLLNSFFGADMPMEAYRQVQGASAALPAEETSLSATRLRGLVLSHRDWIAADRQRFMIQQQWRELFREWDVVVCPTMPTPAFPHDHTPQQTRRIAIDGNDCSYGDQIVWPGVATVPGLPATAVPIGQTDTGLPIGVQGHRSLPGRPHHAHVCPTRGARVRRVRAAAEVRRLNRRADTAGSRRGPKRRRGRTSRRDPLSVSWLLDLGSNEGPTVPPVHLWSFLSGPIRPRGTTLSFGPSRA